MTASAPDRPQVDEVQALGALFPQGFASPVAYAVTLSPPQAGPVPVGPARRDFGALALEAGYLSVAPDPTQPPWWRFDRGASPLAGANRIDLPIGVRTITAQSDQRNWSEGGKSHFAETITYVIRKNPRLTMIQGDQFGPFSVRLVLVKDSSGAWQPTMGTAFLRVDEAGALTRSIDPAMADANARLVVAIGDAKTKAFAAIEQALKDGGVLERDPADGRVLLSRKAGVAYFTKFNSFQSTTLSDLMRYCVREAPAGRGPWRLASEADLKAVIGEAAPGALIDTPDHRLWGALGTPINSVGWDVVVPTSDVVSGDGSKRVSAYGLPSFLTDARVVRYHLKLDGSMAPGAVGWIGYGRTSRERMLAESFGVNGRDDMRVICTAPLKTPSGR